MHEKKIIKSYMYKPDPSITLIVRGIILTAARIIKPITSHDPIGPLYFSLANSEE